MSDTYERAQGAVVVIGSANADLVASVPRRPAGGETVLAHDFERRAGGKGANQAAASARAGARTVFVGAVGDDPIGAEQIEQLEHEGVDTRSVHRLSGVATGTALISVTPEGENSIVVVPGANGLLSGSLVVAALDDLLSDESSRPAAVVVQTEVSAEAIDAAVAWSTKNGIRVVLNDGPVIPLGAATLHAADPLIVNEHEAQELCRRRGPLELLSLARATQEETGARSVVVTGGGAGAVVLTAAGPLLIRSQAAASVIDTTGAGDAFAGTLVAHLAHGAGLEDAARAAVAAATVSVSWPGARPPRHHLPPDPSKGKR
ncbi:ribokinase [Rathayibacter sp. SD072]|uniref:ribokinase n=1 Tax=Rathayibacter sp. SD072 TaxID=2781731 RepID=UPI001A95A41E|nr:ribokinase [Rathayibacter sp. SD072]MBO0982623.1 ribokinase [Rathayibacter sp. SD072]